jgi:hypothetical protein
MLNQLLYEVYTLHHIQKLTRDAETSRMILRMKSDSQDPGYRINWLITKLRSLLGAQNFRKQMNFGELSKKKQGFFQD